MTSTLYTKEVLRLATSIPNLRRLQAPDGQAERRSPICGSRIWVDLCLNEEGRIVDLGQEVRACALGQAAAHLLGAHFAGKTGKDLARTASELRSWLEGGRSGPPEWPGLALFEAARAHPGRHAAICLPFEAAAAAAQNAMENR